MKTLSAIVLGATALASSLNAATFDLNTEIRTVMQDPRAPDVSDLQWQRESYNAIIESARTARLSHGNPYIGETVSLPPNETITVPIGSGNLTNKTVFNIRYMSGLFRDDVWGDDEDIIYLTGDTWNYDNDILEVRAGTIILVAALQNDQKEGAMTPQMIDDLANAYVTDPYPGGLCQSLLYSNWNRTSWLHISGTMMARGNDLVPVIITSDSNENRSYDFKGIWLYNGIFDYCFYTNSQVFCCWPNTLIAHCVLTNHLESGRNGSGWAVANYFGDAHNECEDMGGEQSNNHVAFYNVFEQHWSNAITLHDNAIVELRFNSFIGTGGVGTLSNTTADSRLTLRGNSIPVTPMAVWNGCSINIDAKSNWWGTTNTSTINQRIHDQIDESTVGLVTYQPIISNPPLPWTGGEDSDGDGQPDWQEILDGSNPDDGSSKMPVTNFISLAALIFAIIIVAVIRNRKLILHKGNLN